MLNRFAVAAAMAATVAGLMSLSSPAMAVGSLVDVQVIDRATGNTLPMYWHNGHWWVPGTPGNRYAVALTNRAGGRALTVVSVDGVNVVSGDTAAHDQVGYVLSPGQYAQITGWRKDMTRIAAFEFTALRDSYAARTGRPDNVGVIGVAVFRERPRPMPAPPVLSKPEAARDAASSGAGASAANESDARARQDEAQPREQRLGTGHGRNETLADQLYGLRARPVDAQRADRHPLRQSRQSDRDGRDPAAARGAESLPCHGGFRARSAAPLRAALTALPTAVVTIGRHPVRAQSPAMSAAPTDEELLAAYAAGDARAFGELYERHERPVYRYFLRQGAAPALADDLLQDTWMAVIRNAERFEPRAKFTTWLFTVARSKMIDHWRAKDDAISLEEAANDPDDTPFDVAASESDRPDVQALSRAHARAFVEAVEALPAAQKEAFLLQAEGGLTLEEIATITQVGHETVKSRLRYAMTKLRSAMEAWQ